MKSLSHVQLFATPWTAAYQAPPTMGFSRQEYWSGVPLPSLGEQTGNKLKLHPLNPSQHWSYWRPWEYPTPAQGFQEVDLPRSAKRSSHHEVVTPQPTQGSISPGFQEVNCLDLPRDLVRERLSHLNLLRDLPVWGEGCPRRSNYLDLPRDLVLERLSCLNLLGDPAV